MFNKFTLCCAVLMVIMAINLVEGQGNLAWNVCKRYPKQTLQINSVSINPDPPAAGANLQVVITGVLASDLNQGSTGQVSVQYAGTPMYQGAFDPCEFLSTSNNPCPLKKGPQTLTVVQQITPMAPSGGPYNGTIVINDTANNVVSCLDFNFYMD